MHATCTSFYQAGSEQSDAAGYYRQVNRYFGDAIGAFRKIVVPKWVAQSTVEALKKSFAGLNPSYSVASQFATCDKDPQQKKFLAGLWLCVDGGLNAISCPAGLMKYENCQEEINAR